MLKKIAVVGDVMVDVDNYVYSQGEREGRPCLRVNRTFRRLGAAGAVANMIADLGGIDVALYGSAARRNVIDLKRLGPANFVLLGHEKQTTIRERFRDYDGTPLGPRIDRGEPVFLSPEDQRRLAFQAASGASAVIVCDHQCGVVGRELMEALKQTGVPLFVDPHPQSDFSLFGGVECLCANRNEALGVADVFPDPANVIQKMDADGLVWYKSGWREAPEMPPGVFDPFRLIFGPHTDNVVDPLGAGDQFIATLAVWRTEGESWETSIIAGSIAAGIQCEQWGIGKVTRAQIKSRSS